MRDDRRKSWVDMREETSKLALAQMTTLLMSKAPQEGRKAERAPVRRLATSWKVSGSSWRVSM